MMTSELALCGHSSPDPRISTINDNQKKIKVMTAQFLNLCIGSTGPGKKRDNYFYQIKNKWPILDDEVGSIN
jgi:hypothetical protein